jgi:hypothetical protein
MRKVLASCLLLALLGTAAAGWAGVAPNHGGQNMSGAKIKPPAQNPDPDESAQPADKEQPARNREEQPREEKR